MSTAASGAPATPPTAAERSTLLLWTLGVYFGFKSIAFIQTLIGLVNPTGPTAWTAEHMVAGVALGCIMIFAWAAPILAILLLALGRSQRLVPAVKPIAFAILADFGLQMLLGIAWTMVIMPDIMQASRAGNSQQAAVDAIANHIQFFYAMQILILLITTVAVLVILRQLRTMGGRHKLPAPEEPPSPDDQAGWNERRKATW